MIIKGAKLEKENCLLLSKINKPKIEKRKFYTFSWLIRKYFSFLRFIGIWSKFLIAKITILKFLNKNFNKIDRFS